MNLLQTMTNCLNGHENIQRGIFELVDDASFRNVIYSLVGEMYRSVGLDVVAVIDDWLKSRKITSKLSSGIGLKSRGILLHAQTGFL